MSYAGKTCWIIGASSGIGEALAIELSRRGARLALSARRDDALKAVIAKLDGAGHLSLPLDVTRPEDLAQAAARIVQDFGTLDYAVILAATYNPGLVADLNAAGIRQIIDTNLVGTFNCVHALLPLLRRQKKGVLALCGSVAGYRGLARAQPYGATKAAIINLAETLRIEESANGIDVRVINPGFVETPMTGKNDFDMPMIISAGEAAKCLANQLRGSSFEISFPRKFAFIMKFLRLMPDALYFRIARRFK
jgi:NAD(P)-dependent dehydrogenase (short-subunit alcohol dehydrogenase family)